MIRRRRTVQAWKLPQVETHHRQRTGCNLDALCDHCDQPGGRLRVRARWQDQHHALGFVEVLADACSRQCAEALDAALTVEAALCSASSAH